MKFLSVLSIFILVITSCSEPTLVREGVYDDILNISIDNNKKMLRGDIHMDYQGVLCELYFELDYKELMSSNEDSIILIDFYDNQLKYKAFIRFEESGVYIESPESIYPCQRIMDLSGGEFFFKK